jgi:hypothetical protein
MPAKAGTQSIKQLFTNSSKLRSLKNERAGPLFKKSSNGLKKTNAILVLYQAGSANVVMKTMKKKFIENFVKLLMNGLRSTPKTAGRFHRRQRVRDILESSSYALEVIYIKPWQSVPFFTPYFMINF